MAERRDARELRAAGRNLSFPFRLEITTGTGRAEAVLCQAPLRVLPAKRLVCLGRWREEAVVLKCFLDPRAGRRHSTREAHGVRALQAAEIRTPRLLFEGCLAPGRAPVLVLERIEGAADLREAWNRDPEARGRLLERALAVLAGHHEKGILHADPHLGNFLVDGAIFYTIDGDAVDARHAGTALPEDPALKHLAMFLAPLFPRFEALFPHAFEAYTAQRPGLAWENGYARLLARIAAWKRSSIRRYLRKTVRDCSAFARQRRWRSLCIFDRRDARDLAAFFENPDAFIRHGRPIKQGRSATVVLAESGTRQWVVKRYNLKGPWQVLRRGLRPTRAWNSWCNAHRLRALHILTPRPAALLEKRWGPIRLESYLVTEYVPGTNGQSLILEQAGNARLQQRLADHAARLYRRLSRFSITHGDAKASNFILTPHGLWVVDLDAMRAHRLQWRFRRAFARDCRRLRANWNGVADLHPRLRDRLNQLAAWPDPESPWNMKP